MREEAVFKWWVISMIGLFGVITSAVILGSVYGENSCVPLWVSIIYLAIILNVIVSTIVLAFCF